MAITIPASAASAQMRKAEGLGGGGVGEIVLDESRLCAATYDGIYCKAQDQDIWRPFALRGKSVEFLAKTRSGWAAKADSRGYVSWDSGRTWSLSEQISRLHSNDRGLHAYGDSLLGSDPVWGQLQLSEDGGRSWKSLTDRIPDPLPRCTPSEQSILCATVDNVYRWRKQGFGSAWDTLGPTTSYRSSFVHEGRAYVRDSLGMVSVFGASGLERRFRLALEYNFLAVSSSRVVAHFRKEVAYLDAGDSVWTRLALPYPIDYMREWGVWTGSEVVFQAPTSAPYRMRLEGGEIDFEPVNAGLEHVYAINLSGTGPELFVNVGSGIWRRDAAGNWNLIRQEYLPIIDFWQDQGSAWIRRHYINDREGLFSVDGMKSWHAQSPSLPGDVKSVARLGDRYLALSGIRESRSADTVTVYKLFETRNLLGTWSLRKDFDTAFHSELFTCGPNLFLKRGSRVYTSRDSGGHWVSTTMEHTFPSEGMNLYARDSIGNLMVSRDFGNDWETVKSPWQDHKFIFAVNAAGGQPLAAVHDSSDSVRIYPLPGASPDWRGIEAYPLEKSVRRLYLHGGILYAALNNGGLLAMEAPPTATRPAARPRHAAPHRFRGWRRIDGRALPSGAVPAQVPIFRPGIAR